MLAGRFDCWSQPVQCMCTLLFNLVMRKRLNKSHRYNLDGLNQIISLMMMMMMMVAGGFEKAINNKHICPKCEALELFHSMHMSLSRSSCINLSA